MPGWKVAQSKKQNAEKVRLGLIVLTIILALIILSQTIKFTQFLFNTKRNYTWNGDYNINVLLHSKSVSVLSYSPKNQKVTIIDLPDTTFLEVSRGFGNWQVRSVTPLGGDQLLKDSLANFFAVPIDGFLSCGCDLVDILRKGPFVTISLLPAVKTDLTPFELARLSWAISQVRFDKLKEINLENIGLLEKSKLADGTEIFTSDPIRLDSLSPELIDPNLVSEHKTIAIFNSTDHLNLAQKAARIITNIGGDVIIVANGQNRYKSTQILGEKSKTLDRLRQIFTVNGKIDLKVGDLVSSRAQINVFLGEDFFEKL